MKTRRHRVAAFMATAMALLAMSGCGARSAASGDQESAATSAVPASVSETDALAGTNETAIDTNAPAVPPVLRSDRALPSLKPELAEVVQLVESGAGEEVVRAFVSVSPVAYELTLEEITYLRDVGVPDTVIAAMMRRGGELRDNEAEAANLQTNIIAAVEQLKQAFPTNQTGEATGSPAETNLQAEATPAAPAPPGESPPPEAPEEVQQFYSDLSPYGRWYTVPTYGWVWQPSVVVVNPLWVPYKHAGRWLWTSHGWYWCSDYSWGWAPFHYGRWTTYPGLGWCWVPGRVWGPSWVTWRCTDSYIGWAPLPPGCTWTAGVGLTWYGKGISVGFGFGLASSCYTFVPYSRFCHRNVGHHAAHGVYAGTIYRQSTVINNVISGDNNTIINNGVGYTQIATHTRGEVPKARVEPLPPQADRPLRADRPERSKDGLVVYRPTRVEDVGGKPSPIRYQVGPQTRESSGSLAARPTRTTPTQPNYGSRFNGSPAVDGKPLVNTRGSSPARSPVATPNTSVPRPNTYAPRGTVLAPNYNTPRSGVTPGTVNKGIESRGNATVAPRGDILHPQTPTRQTMPVPLADPTRNIPSRVTPSQTAPPKSIQAGRTPVTATPLANPAQNRGYNTVRQPTPAPAARPQSIYQNPRPATVPQPKMNYQRPTTPSVGTPSPRSYSPAPAPSMSTPRAPVSAPAIRSAPAPRPAVSTPSPVRSVPSPARTGAQGR